MKRAVRALAIIACSVFLPALASGTAAAYEEYGVASYYWQGHTTANGEAYKPDGISAAHKKLPFGTRVKVTHLGTGRTIVVRINDRGPFIAGRIIDLSRGAAAIFGIQGSGVARVKIEVVGGSVKTLVAKRGSPAKVQVARATRPKAVRVASATPRPKVRTDRRIKRVPAAQGAVALASAVQRQAQRPVRVAALEVSKEPSGFLGMTDLERLRADGTGRH